MNIGKNIFEIKNSLPVGTKLVAVSKTKPVELILEAYQAGHKIFGENRAQELVQKYDQLPKDIEWHFIGHLQTNKVKYIAPFVSWIHAVDSFKLLKEINKRAAKENRVIKCLLQFHIATEAAKHGFSEGIPEFLNQEEFQQLKHVRICGVMGMATFTDNQAQIRNEFIRLKQIFNSLKSGYFAENAEFREISMGMSGD